MHMEKCLSVGQSVWLFDVSFPHHVILKGNIYLMENIPGLFPGFSPSPGRCGTGQGTGRVPPGLPWAGCWHHGSRLSWSCGTAVWQGRDLGSQGWHCCPCRAWDPYAPVGKGDRSVTCTHPWGVYEPMGYGQGSPACKAAPPGHDQIPSAPQPQVM